LASEYPSRGRRKVPNVVATLAFSVSCFWPHEEVERAWKDWHCRDQKAVPVTRKGSRYRGPISQRVPGGQPEAIGAAAFVESVLFLGTRITISEQMRRALGVYLKVTDKGSRKGR